jgi:hypothetical protein
VPTETILPGLYNEVEKIADPLHMVFRIILGAAMNESGLIS